MKQTHFSALRNSYLPALIIALLFSLNGLAQSAVTQVRFSTVALMKAYTGASSKAYVVATNKEYITCTSCTADETTVFAGASGKKWQVIVPNAADIPGTFPANKIAPADTVNVNSAVLTYLQSLPGYTTGTKLQSNFTWGPYAQNLLLRSEEFDNALWLKPSGGSVLTNNIAAPDGTTTAEGFIAGTSAYGGLLRQTITYVAGQYTASVYAKAGTSNYVGLRNGPSASPSTYAFINLSTGVATSVAGVTTSVENAGDGWYRFSITFTATAGAGNFFDIAITSSTGGISGTPAGTESVYLWGASLRTEAGVYSTTTTRTIQ